MVVLACAVCGAALTAPVSRIALPVHARHKYGHQLLPPVMESGTYAVDHEPSGPPWRPWNEIAADEAEARGVFAPVPALSFGVPGAMVVAPGDTRGTVLIPERCDGYCLGLDGRDGPNLACVECGCAVATRIDDCGYWQAVWFDPRAVRRVPSDGAGRRASDWEALAREREPVPPIEPPGVWSPFWSAAAGVALAHLLAASDGAAVTVADGPVAGTFGRALDTLLPTGPPERTAVLAGPGMPSSGPGTDIVLVPVHPRTGEVWQPPDGIPAVPLAFDVWAHLAFRQEWLPVPVTGGMPPGVLRDDPLPRHPWGSFRPDSGMFLRTLARLPAVRRPWLRRVHDRVREHPYADPF
ncbi:hypothetical protein [Streptomyces siamensis]|uniref:Uncharacterized protein n=1 Tax=Streptomyces siamensis TaxID=1274986 RepID=A0ABP9JS70_9ACTN